MSSRYTATEAIEPISPIRKRDPLDAPALAPYYSPQPFGTHASSELKPSSPVVSAVASPILTHAADELKSSTQISATPQLSEHPKLTPPDSQIRKTLLTERRFLEEMQKVKERGNAITETVAKRIDIFKREISRLNDENIIKIRERAEKMATSTWWATLKKAAVAFLSALSLALGLSVIAGGGSFLIGGALIASGVLNVVNFACSEAGIWDQLAKALAHNDEERRKKIGMIIPTALGITCAVLGLFGGIQSSAFTSNLGLTLVQAGLSTFQGVTAIGLGISKGRLIHSQADLLKVRSELDAERLNFQLVAQWIENFIAEMKPITDRTGKVASMVMQANQRIVEA